MIYPLVPIFLTSVLAAPVAIVGLIEGFAESIASLLKVISGWLSDKWQKRKPLVVFGYSLSAISKILLGLASSWPFVLVARFIDRFGKGTRTSARDALITESSESTGRGRAFGFHRTFDTLGAVLGPLIALLAIHFLDNKFRLIFLLAFIPAFIGVLLLVFFVKERKKETDSYSSTGKTPPAFHFNWHDFNPSFKIFLLISLIFSLGNSSDAFLILRAQNLGLSLTLVVLVYVLFNLTYSLLSTPAGIISDKIGPKKVLLAGFLLFFGCIPFFWFGALQSFSLVSFSYLRNLYGSYRRGRQGIYF